MSKQIKVSDEVYEKLVYLSKQSFRSIGMQIDYLIEKGGPSSFATSEENKVPSPNYQKNFVVNNQDTSITRDKQIIQEITSLQAEIDAADTYNQDPDYWDVINGKKVKIASLWEEWHAITGR